MFWLQSVIGVIYHPLAAFSSIKYDRDDFSWWPAIILLFLIFPVRIGSIFITQYPVSNLLPIQANIPLEMFKFYVPILSWMVVSFAVTSITDGECHMREIVTATAYSLVPYIVFTIPISLFTKILTVNEAGLYDFLVSVVWAWVAILFVLNVMVMNSYSLGRTLFTVFLNIVGVALFWSIVLLLLALISHFATFVQDLAFEIKYLIFKS
ncbi:MAG TPA: hypothetical protein DDZ89_07705 [Clostridiales bacterium]|nr:hypothetical protein [Clostridiales bacterium]